jgi:hypothetical protein
MLGKETVGSGAVYIDDMDEFVVGWRIMEILQANSPLLAVNLRNHGFH